MATASPKRKEPSSTSLKKHKSSDSEKKRKRPSEEESSSQKKSKKHRSEKKNRSQKEPTPSQPPTRSIPQDPLLLSPFHLQTASLYLPLAPISQRHPLEGLCAEHISPLLLTYYPPLHGVILSYSNARISNEPFQNPEPNGTLLKSIDEYATSWAWVTADFVLFKPERDGWLEGYVNLQNEGHLGIVCWNLFNASIESSRLPRDWKWVGIEGGAEIENESTSNGANYAEDGIGYYVDGSGKKIEETIRFRIKDIEASHDRERGFLSIAGTMLGDKEEAELQQRERTNNKNGKTDAGKRLGGMRALGATNLGVPREPDDDEPQRRRY